MADGNFCLHSVRNFNSWFSKRFISLHTRQRVHSRLQSHLGSGSNPERIESFLTRKATAFCLFPRILFSELNLSFFSLSLPVDVPILKRLENRSVMILSRSLTKRVFEVRSVSVRETLLGCPHPLCICITIQPLLCIIILKCSINEGQLLEGTMLLGLSSKILNALVEIERYWGGLVVCVSWEGKNNKLKPLVGFSVIQ